MKFTYWRIMLFLCIINVCGVLAIDSPRLDVTFELEEHDVRQYMRYSFSEPIHDSNLTYGLDRDIDEVEVIINGFESDYELLWNGSLIYIVPAKPVDNLTLIFTTKDAIFKNGNILHFFAELDLENQLFPNISVSLILPKGYGIYEEIALPPNPITSSDGQSIILRWDSLSTKEPIFFSIKFMLLKDSKMYLPIFFSVILLALVIFLVFYLKKSKDEALLHGFRSEEQDAIQYIRTHKEIWQKDLQKEFSFSRAKSTRIIKKLEEKHLIKKEGWGRTNKIFWSGEIKKKEEKVQKG